MDFADDELDTGKGYKMTRPPTEASPPGVVESIRAGQIGARGSGGTGGAPSRAFGGEPYTLI